MEEELEEDIDLEPFSAYEIKVMTKQRNDESIFKEPAEIFVVTIISDKYGEYKIDADETMKIHDFKRIILNYKNEPFFLEY